MNRYSSAPLRLLKGFGKFWWDFLVGDTPELFLAALVMIGTIALVSEVGHFNTVAIVLLPFMAVLALVASLARANRASRKE
ncbi:MAG: hypothetical protein ABI298_01720 [Acidimicrobiales bacterium]